MHLSSATIISANTPLMKATHVVKCNIRDAEKCPQPPLLEDACQVTWQRPQVCNSLTGGKEESGNTPTFVIAIPLLICCSVGSDTVFFIQFVSLTNYFHHFPSGLWMWLLFWVFLHWLQLLYPWPMLRAFLCHQGRHLEFEGPSATAHTTPIREHSGVQMVGPETSCHLLWTATPVATEGGRGILKSAFSGLLFQHNLVLLKIPILLFNVVNPGWFQGLTLESAQSALDIDWRRRISISDEWNVIRK